MKKIKENKGITLIALIITIIVMLILVGVTVSVALNGGLFKKAREAVSKTEQGKEKELIQLAYADYLAEKVPNKVPEELELYFLGESKTGKNVEDFMKEDEDGNVNLVETEDPEDSDRGTIEFKNVNDEKDSIIIRYPDDVYIVNEGEEAWYYFEYKDNKYGIRINVDENGDAVVTELVLEPQLEVKDATVTGNNREGWKIVFENTTGNSYDLLPDGRIENLWWRATDEEKEKMESLVIARNDDILVGFGAFYGSDGYTIAIYFTDTYKMYYFPLTSSEVEALKNQTNVDVEMYQWYTGYQPSTTIQNLSKYEGASPISLNDFAEDEIYCKSYLERIIKSFNQ